MSQKLEHYIESAEEMVLQKQMRLETIDYQEYSVDFRCFLKQDQSDLNSSPCPMLPQSHVQI